MKNEKATLKLVSLAVKTPRQTKAQHIPRGSHEFAPPHPLFGYHPQARPSPTKVDRNNQTLLRQTTKYSRLFCSFGLHCFFLPAVMLIQSQHIPDGIHEFAPPHPLFGFHPQARPLPTKVDRNNQTLLRQTTKYSPACGSAISGCISFFTCSDADPIPTHTRWDPWVYSASPTRSASFSVYHRSQRTNKSKDSLLTNAQLG